MDNPHVKFQHFTIPHDEKWKIQKTEKKDKGGECRRVKRKGYTKEKINGMCER
jgi:hypothetical protein